MNPTKDCFIIQDRNEYFKSGTDEATLYEFTSAYLGAQFLITGYKMNDMDILFPLIPCNIIAGQMI